MDYANGATREDVHNANPVQDIDRLRPDVERILPLHGRVVPMSELRTTAAGRR